MMRSLHNMMEESNSVKDLRNIYKPIYHNIGIGRVVGYIIFLMYFTLLPALLKKIWPILITQFDSTSCFS